MASLNALQKLKNQINLQQRQIDNAALQMRKDLLLKRHRIDVKLEKVDILLSERIERFMKHILCFGRYKGMTIKQVMFEGVSKIKSRTHYLVWLQSKSKGWCHASQNTIDILKELTFRELNWYIHKTIRGY